MTALTLWLPMPPDNANGRGHWAALNRAKTAYLRELDHRARAGLIPDPPAAPLACALLAAEVHYPTRRHPIDSDNVIRRLKPVADWLVRRGYLAGDTPRHLTWESPTHVVGAPTPVLSRVRLTLTPVPTP